MFGYASDETSSYMPLPIQLSHQLLKTIRNKRVENKIMGLGPDAKSQFSIVYEGNQPVWYQTLQFYLYNIWALTKHKTLKILFYP